MEKFEGNIYTLIFVLLVFISQSIAEEETKFVPDGHEHGLRGKGSEACKWLIPNCGECFDATWCGKCKKGYLALESFWGMECVPDCPAGYYEGVRDSYSRVCVKTLGCKYIYNCAECSERYLAVDSYKCDRCQAGYFLFAAVLGGETACVEECPAGYRQHGRRCMKVGCRDFFCSSCEKGWVLQHKGADKEHTRCVRQCPKGYFKQVDHYWKNAVCAKCKLHCCSCHDSSNCNECEKGYALLSKESTTRCVENCPPSYRLVKNLSRHPAICALDRKGCLDKRCHKCNEGYFYIRTHGISQCLEDCPTRYFKSEVHDFKLGEQRRCSKCVHKCLACTNEKDCQKCDDGYKKLVVGRRNRAYCLQSCPLGYDTIEDQEGHEMCLNPREPKTP